VTDSGALGVGCVFTWEFIGLITGGPGVALA
jgi:hypothetical protein